MTSDASDKAGGYVIDNDIGNIVLEKTERWPDDIAKMHIYVQEVLAAVHCITDFLDSVTEPTTIVIGIDNTAAAVAAIHGMYL